MNNTKSTPVQFIDIKILNEAERKSSQVFNLCFAKNDKLIKVIQKTTAGLDKLCRVYTQLWLASTMAMCIYMENVQPFFKRDFAGI